VTVYSADRVRRLRMIVLVVAGLGGVLAVFSFGLVFSDDNRGVGVFSLAVAAVLIAVSTTAHRRLLEGDAVAKRLTVGTGVAALVGGLLLAGTWMAFVLPLVGLATLFLALVGDEPS
jgi:drug/metabolite transporter (DMT)-like permease